MGVPEIDAFQEVSQMNQVKMSPNAEKVYRYMKDHGYVGEEKGQSADVIAHPHLKMAKNNVMNALQELVGKNIVKRKAREKSASYFIIPGKDT
ncbi:MAG: transcriptional regulator [Thermoplasmatota archaeon]